MTTLSASVPRPAAGAPTWAARLVQDLADWVMAIRRGPQVLTLYTVANLPDATKYHGGQVQVTNEAGGEVPAFSDGINWRRYTDRAIVT